MAEIKRINKLFHFRNPFRSRSKEQAKHEKMLAERAQEESRVQSEMRAGRYQSRMRTTDGHATAATNGGPSGSSRPVHAYASTVIDSDLLDEEDRRQEQSIDQGLQDMSRITANLKSMAVNMHSEVDHQNRMLNRLNSNSDDLKARLAVTESRMRQIK